MKVKCFIDQNHNHLWGPEAMLKVLSGKESEFTPTHDSLSSFSAIHLERDYSHAQSTTRNPFSVDIMGADRERGLSLGVAGDRNSVLELFRKADQKPMIYVNTPPGVFIGVFRKERLFKSDITVVRITSGDKSTEAPEMRGVGYKHGNLYSKSEKKKTIWRWHWYNVTNGLGLDSTSGTTTVHPQAFALLLKNIFDTNKWW